MISETALIIGKLQIPWNAILIGLTIPAWFFFSYSLYSARVKKSASFLLLFPLTVITSFFFCRLFYWYSNQSQFEGLFDALDSFNLAAFSLLGLLPGILIPALLLWAVRLIKKLPVLLDTLAAPTAFATGFFYLTCLFNNSCRAKFVIHHTAFQRFPVSVLSTDALGNIEYRFATFMAGFILMSLVGIFTLWFYFRNYKKEGATLAFFLLFYSAVQFILESTRYDACYFPFNGFVSIIQIVSAVCIAGSMIYYSILSVKKTGFRAVYPVLWFLHIAAIGATGYLEYLVQRHGDKAAMLYLFMSLSCFLMAFIPVIVYFCGKSGRKSQIPRKKSGA